MDTTRLRFHWMLFVLAIEATMSGYTCAAAESELSSEEAAKTFVWTKDAFSALDCCRSEEDTKELDSHDQPLLRWSNPAIGRIYGEVFLWTANQRPAAIVSLYEWHSPYTERTAEFLSLSEGAFHASANDDVLWATETGGLEWKTFESTTAASATASVRLVQMRRFVARFEITLDDMRNNDRGEVQALRKLTRPIYRYHDTNTGLIDGALFAFVAGTDPEAFLIVELRENHRAKRSWHYALARMNCDAITAKLDGHVVQRFCDVRDVMFDRKQPYCTAQWPKANREPTKLVTEEQP